MSTYKKSFGLVEVIAAQGIVLIVLAIVFPILINQFSQAKKSKVDKTASTIYKAASAIWLDAYTNNDIIVEGCDKEENPYLISKSGVKYNVEKYLTTEIPEDYEVSISVNSVGDKQGIGDVEVIKGKVKSIISN